MKSFEEHWKEIGENFDWEKARKTMKLLNWSWYDTNGEAPSVFRLMESVKSLMESAYKIHYENQLTTSTGGFSVTYYREYDYFDVKFVITDWSTEYLNPDEE